MQSSKLTLLISFYDNATIKRELILLEQNSMWRVCINKWMSDIYNVIT